MNSPGADDAPCVVSGLFVGGCRGSRLSVKGPGVEEGGGGGGGGAGIEAGGGGLPVPAGVPPPKIRVNSPGVRVDCEVVGREVNGDSAGVASGLRNSRVNSPGCGFSDTSGGGGAGAGCAIGGDNTGGGAIMGGGVLGWLCPPRPNSCVNSPGTCSSAAGGGTAGAGAAGTPLGSF